MKRCVPLFVPLLAACGGMVDLGEVTPSDPDPGTVVPTPPPAPTPVAVQMSGWCGLFDDHRVRCWSRLGTWLVQGLRGNSFAAAGNTAGHGQVCAVSEDGAMTCVSTDCYSPTGDCVAYEVPYEFPVARPAVAASLEPAGGSALRADGTFQSWGLGVPSCAGLMPDGLDDDQRYNWVIDPVALESPIVSLDQGGDKTCFVTADGRVYCTVTTLDEEAEAVCAWPPVPVREMLGGRYVPGPDSSSDPPEVTDAVKVVVDDYLTCILHRTGHVTCHGIAVYLGAGITDLSMRGAEVSLIDDAIDIVGDYDTACAIRSDRSLWCWGKNAYEGLGPGADYVDGQGFYNVVPHRVEGVMDVRAAGIAGGQVCAGEADGDMWCWGGNAPQQLQNIVIEPAPPE